MIHSYEDLVPKWPGLRLQGREAHGPCPFCNHDHSTQLNEDGVGFTGSERMWFYPQNLPRGATCRGECAREKRGPKGNGWYPIQMVMQKLGLEIADDIEVKPSEPARPIYNLWRDADVEKAHAAVNYEYWMSTCRWPKALVDEFKLGYGNMPNAGMGMSHLIPMHPQKADEAPTEGWYIAARKPGRKGSVRGLGSSKNYFWFVETDRSSKTVAVVESEKNAITAKHLGYKNAVATYGAGNLYPEMIAYLWSLGYRHILLMGDTGAPGEHFNQEYAKYAVWSKFETIKEILWPDDFGDNYDITDLNRDKDNARQLIDSWLADVYVPDGEIDEDVTEAVALDVLRGSGPQSIEGIVRAYYEAYKSGTMLVPAMPPGMGKTHALVRFVEEKAAEYKAQRQIEWDELNEQLSTATDEKTRETLLGQISRFSWTAVAWFGQYVDQWNDIVALGANTDDWFDFKARSYDNCGQYDTVSKLAEANHDIGRYCQTACPLKEKCLQSGYLAQEQQRKQKPITFFRHQNLFMPIIREYPLMAVVDESATHLWEQDAVLQIEARDLYPHISSDDVENKQEFEQISVLLAAVRAAMSTNAGAEVKSEEHQIGAVPFMKLIDEQLTLNDTSLQELLPLLDDDTLKYYQPNFISGDPSQIRKRCVKELIKMLRQYLPKYIENPNRHNLASSRMWLIGGMLELYLTPQIPLPKRVPLIVADGTAMPETLSAMFKREPIVRRPEHINPNVETIHVVGSDWTKGSLNRDIGNKWQRAKKVAEKIVAKSAPDAPIYTADLPIGGDVFDSQYLQEAVELIQGLTEKHDRLLVVGYKMLRDVLQSQLFLADPSLEKKVALAHYGALRGTNKYQDYPAVLLIGAYRIPYDVIYRIVSMWVDVFGKDDNPISNELVKKELRYDGQPTSGEYLTYAHPFADKYVNQREQSEMRQSLERIRPHSSLDKKYIYICATRPVGKRVTKIVRKKAFLDDMRPSKTRALYLEYIRVCRHTLEHEGKIKPPGYDKLQAMFGVSHTTISNVKKRIIKEGIFPGWNGK